MTKDFDHWRERYDTLTFAEQQEYHNQLEEWYPDHAHFDFEAAKYAIDTTGSFVILEKSTRRFNWQKCSNFAFVNQY